MLKWFLKECGRIFGYIVPRFEIWSDIFTEFERFYSLLSSSRDDSAEPTIIHVPICQYCIRLWRRETLSSLCCEVPRTVAVTLIMPGLNTAVCIPLFNEDDGFAAPGTSVVLWYLRRHTALLCSDNKTNCMQFCVVSIANICNLRFLCVAVSDYIWASVM
jgi:hypothetical protein